jgi:leucyl/phenylalanyl-tRNA--protein transferase
VENALDEPDGLLAAGGDLSAARLLHAYPRGIFPWYDSGQPILWWSPDPRCVFQPDRFRLSRRMQRERRNSALDLTFNRAFDGVIAACAAPRRKLEGTWITSDMRVAYQELHELGWAHSVELWRDGRLVGGVYGVAIGRVFFGESMFSRETNASKFALHALCVELCRNGFALLDCQTVSRHLLSLGAVTLPRKDFTAALQRYCNPAIAFAGWPRESRPVRELPALTHGAALQ